jgi:hypothetical protein
MILKPTPIHSSQFTFSKNTFISELSDLGPAVRFERVYDDACDIGFTIISEKTGMPAVFAFNGNRTDGEGDLIALDFICVTPGLKYLKAVLFNV